MSSAFSGLAIISVNRFKKIKSRFFLLLALFCSSFSAFAIGWGCGTNRVVAPREWTYQCINLDVCLGANGHVEWSGSPNETANCVLSSCPNSQIVDPVTGMCGSSSTSSSLIPDKVLGAQCTAGNKEISLKIETHVGNPSLPLS